MHVFFTALSFYGGIVALFLYRHFIYVCLFVVVLYMYDCIGFLFLLSRGGPASRAVLQHRLLRPELRAVRGSRRDQLHTASVLLLTPFFTVSYTRSCFSFTSVPFLSLAIFGRGLI